jgi:hypothetical protein
MTLIAFKIYQKEDKKEIVNNFKFFQDCFTTNIVYNVLGCGLNAFGA